MDFFANIISRAQCRADARQVVLPRVALNHERDFSEAIDDFTWSAVRYIDGPMRPYMEKDPMFANFCANVESFEALFKASTSLVECHDDSKGIPRFLRHYLHQRITIDLDWLDTEGSKSGHHNLQRGLVIGQFNRVGFEVGVVLSLAVHLLQLIPLYGPTTDGPDDGFHPWTSDYASNSEGDEYRSSELLMKSIGHEPHFRWVGEGRDANCYFAVSHKSPGSMDRCWLDPTIVSGRLPNVNIDPAFHGQNYRGRTDDNGLDSDGQVIEEYDSPEKCLCIFMHEDAAKPILHPSKERDPAAHEDCAMMLTRPGPSLPIAHSEMYKLQASRNPYMARKWKDLCKSYRAKSRRASLLANIRTSFV
ncbi:hypothetical protein F4803DRAFT_530320 [Xylaria telfairii]|nr:hypothetical protein F4803DRAFT_530320 [Xylaria telfairii]